MASRGMFFSTEMVSQDREPLSHFFIFDASFNTGEGQEDEKLLYYFSAESKQPTSAKLNNLGLAEAVIKFLENFTTEKCDSVHLKKSRHIFYEPEEHYVMVMYLDLESPVWKQDGEFDPSSLKDSVFKSLLKQIYATFRLFHGCFATIQRRSGRAGLRERLATFLNEYLGCVDVAGSDLLSVFNGLKFLPLDQSTYLCVQCLMNRLQQQYSPIRHTAFMCDDFLVWSGLDQDDIQILYRYLVDVELPRFSEFELGNPTLFSHSHQYGRYVLGPRVLSAEVGRVEAGRPVFTRAGTRPFRLIVYKASGIVIILLLDPQFETGSEWFRSIDQFMLHNLAPLVKPVRDHLQRRKSYDSQLEFKYIYFNRINLAVKSTVHNEPARLGEETHRARASSVPPFVLSLAADISDLFRSGGRDCDVTVSTQSDYWLVGKKFDFREVYVIIQKQANLSQVTDEVRRLFKTQFANIFFLD